MNLKIYQSYYEPSQLSLIDPSLIAYDNTENKYPKLREYPLFKVLYQKHINSNDYWGLLSWRWLEKTKLAPEDFKSWILDTPGYDVYHFDPFLDITVSFPNSWLQGDIWHPGMRNFCNRLLFKLGIEKNVENLIYDVEDFGACNFFVANSKYWTGYIKFVDNCIEICNNDSELNEYINREAIYNGLPVPNFAFVIERLFSLHNTLFKKDFKVKKFPVENPCYERIYGNNYNHIINLYRNRQDIK